MAILLGNADASKPVLEGQQIPIHEGTIADLGRKIHTRGLPSTKGIDCSQLKL
jgi:hypothetical protein